jgi:predicted PurR-regulated permease PerM
MILQIFITVLCGAICFIAMHNEDNNITKAVLAGLIGLIPFIGMFFTAFIMIKYNPFDD